MSIIKPTASNELGPLAAGRVAGGRYLLEVPCPCGNHVDFCDGPGEAGGCWDGVNAPLHRIVPDVITSSSAGNYDPRTEMSMLWYGDGTTESYSTRNYYPVSVAPTLHTFVLSNGYRFSISFGIGTSFKLGSHPSSVPALARMTDSKFVVRVASTGEEELDESQIEWSHVVYDYNLLELCRLKIGREYRDETFVFTDDFLAYVRKTPSGLELVKYALTAGSVAEVTALGSGYTILKRLVQNTDIELLDSEGLRCHLALV